jgi:nicotinamide-nucleotide adenylyltransferase
MKTNEKRALYLGRFQPFHNGHMNIIKELCDEYDQVVIALCSAQCRNTPTNPFSYHERYEMMTQSLHNQGLTEGQDYIIIPIPDINCYEKWADFCNVIYGDYDVVITNNPDTRKLFEKRGDKVEGHELSEYNGKMITGTRIRNLLTSESNPFPLIEKMIPDEVYFYIRSHHLDRRMKRIIQDKDK